MQSELFDLLFLDVLFGVENGIEAIERLKILQPDCEIVVMTGTPEVDALLESKRKGAFDYLAKPIRKASLLYHVQKILPDKSTTP